MGDLSISSGSPDSASTSSTSLDSTTKTTPVNLAAIPGALSNLICGGEKGKPHATPTFAGLPDELVDAICSNLQPALSRDGASDDTSTQDFYNLCLVCRQCLRAATPYLYSRFRHELYKRPERVHLFLRNVIRDPQLVGHTHYMSIKDQESCGLFQNMAGWRQWAAKSYFPSLSEADKELFRKAAHELHLHRVDALDAIAEKEEAQAALLLSRTTNLTHLRMTIPNVGKNRLLLEILKETTDQGTALQNLRTFSGVYYNFDGPVDGGFELAPISSLFRLPKIEAVDGIACLEPEDDAFRGFDCPEGTSTVKEIKFRRSSICPKAMGLMVGACKALKRLYCDWGGHTVGWSEINFRIVGAALRKQEESLESLTLDVRKHYDVWPEREDVLIPPLGSFVGFKRLTSIEAPAAALIGWDEGSVDGFPMLHEILPYVIERLVINQWSPGIFDHLEKLAEVCASMYPRLRDISLHGASEDADEGKMQKLFDKYGAEVRIRFARGEEVDHWS